jgi:hypothetical protein
MDGNGVGRWQQRGSGIGRWHWEATLGGVLERQLKMQQQHWVAAVAEEQVTIALVSALLKPRAYHYDVSVSIGEDGKKGIL